MLVWKHLFIVLLLKIYLFLYTCNTFLLPSSQLFSQFLHFFCQKVEQLVVHGQQNTFDVV